MRRSANSLMSEEEEQSKVSIKDNNNSKRCKMENKVLENGNGCQDENVDQSNKQKSNYPDKPIINVLNENNAVQERKNVLNLKRRSKEGEDIFSKLSDELLLQIMQYMPKKCLVECACVSRRWRSVCYDDSLWQRIDLTGRTLQTDTMAYIVARNPRLLKMSQAEVCTPMYQECDTLVNFEWKLEYLDLSLAVIACADLALLLRNCSQLRKLSLEHCTADLDVCRSVANNAKLETLNMTMCYNVGYEGIKLILENCQKLKELNLGWTNMDLKTIEAVCSLVNENITHLDISGCRSVLNDECSAQLLNRCKSLVHLDMSDCTMVSDVTFEKIRENLSELQQLSISRCYKMSPSLYPTLSYMRKLSYLNVFGVLSEKQLEMLQKAISRISINKNKFSTVARPTVGSRRTSIWGLKTRD